jgi:hypothetical protein
MESSDNLLNAGDRVVFPGKFKVAPGASVILDDADGTQSTLVDGRNARISGGGISVLVTGNPSNVVGGNGVANDSVCNSIVATTGVAAVGGASVSGSGGASGSGGSSGSEALVGLLPDTGGESLLALLAGLASAGTGLLIVQRLRARANRASRG